MNRLVLIVMVYCTAGCMKIYRAANDLPNPDAAEVAKAAAPLLGCLAERITVVDDSEVSGYNWTATGCSSSAACKGSWSKWTCLKLPLPWWWDTDDQTPVEVSIERLALETGCAPGFIEAHKGTAAFVARGGNIVGEERAYRLTACGKPYVCAVHAPTINCKAALVE